jgi:hypothetical protein
MRGNMNLFPSGSRTPDADETGGYSILMLPKLAVPDHG